MVSTTHVVLFRYKSDIPWTTLTSHFRAFASLKHTCLKNGKPYMLSMRMGKNTSWENFGRGMTHCFMLEFASEGDRDYYLLKDKVHRSFSESAKDLIEDSVVVDWKDGILFDDIMTPDTSTIESDSTSSSVEAISKGKLMNGSCHCGNVTWEVRLSEYRHVICHCRTCQLLGGGPYSCNAIVGKDDLSIKTGQLNVYSYVGASGKSVLCYYCGNCTSHVYHHQMSDPDKIIARTLLLDSGNLMGVEQEIFAETKLPWVADLRAALTS